MAGKKGMKHYPVELKLEAVRLCEQEGCTRAQVTAALGIRDPLRLDKWLRQYRAEGASAFSKPIGRPRKGPQAEVERLRMEVALLKKLRSELRERLLAPRNIGRSTTSGRTSR
jgi:transposase-like protein